MGERFHCFESNHLSPVGTSANWAIDLQHECLLDCLFILRKSVRKSTPSEQETVFTCPQATLGSMISMTQESEAYLQRSLDSTFFLSLETSMRANLANSPTSTLSNCLAVSIAMVFAFGTVGSINFLAFFTTRSKKTGCRATILVFLASFRMDGMD